MSSKRRVNPKHWLKVVFIFGVAAILLVALALVAVLEYVMIKTGVMIDSRFDKSPFLWVLIFSSVSIIIGLGLAFLLSKIIFKPFNIIVDGLTALAEGNYGTRIDLGENESMKLVADKFNALASELSKTQILRSDFVNNFSHELKTPIASVRTLVTLLRKEDIPQSKKLKYLEIVEEEIDRLTGMTTNILNLSKIENQGILTEVTLFNLSEQIRSCVLLYEKKWTAKRLDLVMDFKEYYVRANEDMLRHVWSNLIDNAIKYSFEGGKLEIAVNERIDALIVQISNQGEPILKEDEDKIFNKFYQGKSKSDGNGIGLSIVKHAVQLHGGSVGVSCDGGVTTFTVTLPKQ